MRAAARALAAGVASVVVVLAAACTSLPRRFEDVAAHVDDAAITSTVKSRLAEDSLVDAQAVQVETANGNVALSGTARNGVEKSTAESIAIKVPGVKSLQNNIVVRP